MRVAVTSSLHQVAVPYEAATFVKVMIFVQRDSQPDGPPRSRQIAHCQGERDSLTIPLLT